MSQSLHKYFSEQTLNEIIQKRKKSTEYEEKRIQLFQDE